MNNKINDALNAFKDYTEQTKNNPFKYFQSSPDNAERPKTFMDYEPGKIPSSNSTKTEQKKNKSTSLTNKRDKGFDNFLKGFNIFDDEEESGLTQEKVKKIPMPSIPQIGKNQSTQARNLILKPNENFGKIQPFSWRPNSGEKKNTDAFLEGFNSFDDEREDNLKKHYVTDEPSLYGFDNIEDVKKGFQRLGNDAVNAGKWIFETARQIPQNIIEKIPKNSAEFKDMIASGSNFLAEKGVLDDVINRLAKQYNYLKYDSAGTDATTKLAGILYHKNMADKNYEYNRDVDLRLAADSDGYIRYQKTGPIKKLRYGNKLMEENGCGVIAVYNSLNTLNNPRDIRDIAHDFELCGQVLGGMFGTDPYAVGDYFRNMGYDVKTYEGDSTIDKLDLPDADTYILTSLNSSNILRGVHFVSFHKTKSGRYKVINTGRGIEYKDSLPDYMYNRKEKSIPMVLHCISKRR